MAKPVLYYFPIRGRAEPIRLLLALKGIEYEEQSVEYSIVKSDLEHFPFAQVPAYDDGKICMSQSNAIMRYIGRQHGMAGTDALQCAEIDQIVDGIEDIKRKYLALIYQDSLAEDAKAAYWRTHVDASTTAERNGGAHFKYVSGLVTKYGKDGWAVSTGPSIADILLFDIVELHERVFGMEKVKEAYPGLVAIRKKLSVSALPGIKDYLESGMRKEKVNNNALG